jgi:hypothetical protein
MTLMNIVTAGAITIGAGLVPLYASGTQERVTVTGCAIRADGDGDGFLLTKAVGEAKTPRMLYWLDDDDDEVEKLMGQLVEVTGDIEGEVKRAEIEVERESGMIELDIKSGGRKATVKLPEGSAAIGSSQSVKAQEVELEYDVRKLEVKSAKSIAPSCK